MLAPGTPFITTWGYWGIINRVKFHDGSVEIWTWSGGHVFVSPLNVYTREDFETDIVLTPEDLQCSYL